MSFLLLNTGGGDDLLLTTGDHLLLSGDQDLRWEPHFPDRCPPKPHLRASRQQFSAMNLDPIVNPPPPVPLVWQPNYPARPTRRLLPRPAMQFFASGSPFLGTALRARAFFPDRFPARRLRHYQQSFEIGAVIDVPKTGGWRPTYPSILRPARRPNLGFSAWVVDYGTLLNAAPCVEWTDETLTASHFDDEQAISPGMTDETVTLPTLTEEDVC